MSFSSNLNHYGMVHMASVNDVLLDTSFTPPCQRMGAMVSFRSFQEFTKSVPRWSFERGSFHSGRA